jgi:hypothetical protein
VITAVAPSLQALLERVIDYAGMYPPAGLLLEEAIANYSSYRHGEYSWMLRSLVVGAGELPRLPDWLNGSLALLTDSDDVRAASLETKTVISAKRPVYCEIAGSDDAQFDSVKQSGCFAKIRTGGLTPEAIPTTAHVANFIVACAGRRLPFKATAGLHHPMRATYPLTYETQAPRAVMHGFLNVLLASAFAWRGEQNIEGVLAETDPSAFSFDERAHWRDWSIGDEEIRNARQHFIHSIGSCSFDEPVHELQALKLL